MSESPLRFRGGFKPPFSRSNRMKHSAEKCRKLIVGIAESRKGEEEQLLAAVTRTAVIFANDLVILYTIFYSIWNSFKMIRYAL